MTYWAAARLEPRREQLGLHCLGLKGYTTYFPRIRERRVVRGRKVEVRLPLFPGYAFVTVEAQWYSARWSVGVIGFVMDGLRPGRVPDGVVAEIRSRECNGLIILPKPPKPRAVIEHGGAVRIARGPLSGMRGLYQGMRGSDRVEVLLELLGRVTLSRGDVDRV